MSVRKRIISLSAYSSPIISLQSAYKQPVDQRLQLTYSHPIVSLKLAHSQLIVGLQKASKPPKLVYVDLNPLWYFGEVTFNFLLFRIYYFETDFRRFELRFISEGIQRVSDSRCYIFSSFSLLKTTSEHKSNTSKHQSRDNNKKIVFYQL